MKSLRNQPVIPVPDIYRLHFTYHPNKKECDEDDDNDDDYDDTIPPFVILACDGVWDVMNNRQVIQFVMSRLKKQLSTSQSTKMKKVSKGMIQSCFDAHAIARELVEYCVLEQKSNDNVSVIILLLPGAQFHST